MIRFASFLIGGTTGLIGGAAIDHYATDAFADKLAPGIAALALFAVLVWCGVAIAGARREAR